ncbi:hypothetical protein MKW98_014612 [Papaver atlanticum]|uniref:Uncharacterized protein n=1 Tax=Papaver atlanticum TaxID=357466 RepID=A0AAD4SGI7_9MAGN|nr:hypothetical protein MKW98_014612 [Papaver atlanticum]
MALGLGTGVPWVMCKQDDVHDHIVKRIQDQKMALRTAGRFISQRLVGGTRNFSRNSMCTEDVGVKFKDMNLQILSIFLKLSKLCGSVSQIFQVGTTVVTRADGRLALGARGRRGLPDGTELAYHMNGIRNSRKAWLT